MNDELAEELFCRFAPEKLIGAGGFYPIDQEQIIFYYEPWQSYVITTISDEEEYHTGHYDLLPENDPFELINGKLIYMAAPKLKHQEILSNLHGYLWMHVQTNKLGKVLPAPTDVELNKKTVVQPDILFVSVKRRHIAEGEARIVGAPDFVVEILSTNEDDDRIRKMQLYAEHDVLEYWIVAPQEQTIEVYQNEQQQMRLVQKVGKGETVRSKVIEGFVLELDKVFD